MTASALLDARQEPDHGEDEEQDRHEPEGLRPAVVAPMASATVAARPSRVAGWWPARRKAAKASAAAKRDRDDDEHRGQHGAEIEGDEHQDGDDDAGDDRHRQVATGLGRLFAVELLSAGAAGAAAQPGAPLGSASSTAAAARRLGGVAPPAAPARGLGVERLGFGPPAIELGLGRGLARQAARPSGRSSRSNSQGRASSTTGSVFSAPQRLLVDAEEDGVEGLLVGLQSLDSSRQTGARRPRWARLGSRISDGGDLTGRLVGPVRQLVRARRLLELPVSERGRRPPGRRR